MKESIPASRLFWYIVLLGLVPVFFAGLHVINRVRQVSDAERALTATHEKLVLEESREGLNRAIREKFSEADHHYIDKNLEALTLLTTEQETLSTVSKQKTGIFDDRLLERLKKLKTENHLVFAEGVVQAYPQFQETSETLTHPVEVSVEDVKRILTMVEGVDIDGYHAVETAPQLIVTQFTLSRKKISERHEVFELNMKLLKREFY